MEAPHGQARPDPDEGEVANHRRRNGRSARLLPVDGERLGDHVAVDVESTVTRNAAVRAASVMSAISGDASIEGHEGVALGDEPIAGQRPVDHRTIGERRTGVGATAEREEKERQPRAERRIGGGREQHAKGAAHDELQTNEGLRRRIRRTVRPTFGRANATATGVQGTGIRPTPRCAAAVHTSGGL